ncbi:Leucine-rich repeat-containing protein [Cynara cardunculus var. scolymus]|uniref:Leucine-rich repeat-containing protein n=1 Tax=Cynara cardunculus var. scolymus TaxID=59895 RepID=A0A103YF28_CYNCS|nr:Leucine-rich repeat-containing protein [Cynara cardunculus var. scolymus]
MVLLVAILMVMLLVSTLAVGTIHQNTTLFNLPHLERLDLAFNDFTNSHLPSEIGRFSNSLTHLNISKCGFVGQVPTDITFLRKLVSLDLSSNSFGVGLEPRVFNNLLQNSTHLRVLSLAYVNLSLVLPTYLNISSTLKSLDLRSTHLQGKLPQNIFNLQYMENLQLSENYITGQLPKVNASANIPLKHLHLSSNDLSGDIPFSIGHLESLETLIISYCGFMGPLPKSMVNLRHLTTIDLSSNMLNGTLPSWLFTLPSLEIIDLSNNKFHGSLPLEMFNHQSLKKLSLGNNQMVGKIDVLDHVPTLQTFQKLTSLTVLDLSLNNFTGHWELETLLLNLRNLISFDLSYSGLYVMTYNANGYINPDFRYLALRSCKLTVFPESLRAMKDLWYLDLSSNAIRGHIPDWVGEIGGNELGYLNLSHNFIEGLPQLRWYGLRQLHLQSNKIQGPFPPSICNMSILTTLVMSNNRFGGVIPHCVGNISSNLNMMDLGNNHFHGTIPNAYEHCGELAGLILNQNQLEGEVSSSLLKCQYLEVLNLENNLLNGTFPGWLGDLPFLKILDLNLNNFHGPIETSSTRKVPFPCLQVLDLSHNGFVSHLPQKYFQSFNAMKNVVKNREKPSYLSINGLHYSMNVDMKGVEQSFPQIFVHCTILDLSNNRFEGEIPDIICSLKALIVLDLSHNSLIGRIPHALGNLLEIESLDLSCNQLAGEIPKSLADLRFLEFLNLSQNHLAGRIPIGKQFNTFEENSFGGNPRLCGLPLPEKCEHPYKPPVKVDGDPESEFTWIVFMLGYGCGTLVGLVMGYLMLSTGRPMWLSAIVDATENMIKTRYMYIGK